MAGGDKTASPVSIKKDVLKKLVVITSLILFPTFDLTLVDQEVNV